MVLLIHIQKLPIMEEPTDGAVAKKVPKPSVELTLWSKRIALSESLMNTIICPSFQISFGKGKPGGARHPLVLNTFGNRF